MLGKLKHACIEYMLSRAEEAELDEQLLYLSLAHRYEISNVEDKVLGLIYKTSTTDILKCANYDMSFVAPLMVRHAQWLEENPNFLTTSDHWFK